jgi:regulator of PEP synthase PpsR (kinase-PPPase family)
LGEAGLSEVRIGEVPIPLANYVFLIKYRRSPYYDIVQHLLREMEIHYERVGEGSEVIYTINPRMLQEEIEERVRSEKVTTVNICRTILALLYGCRLREGEDFYVTTTSGGRRNYHIRVNSRTLSLMRSFL